MTVSLEPAAASGKSPARLMTSVSRGRLHFVVFDAPSDATLPAYLSELKARNVGVIARVCEAPTYSAAAAMSLSGIKVVDLPFPDGSVPPVATITAFLDICQATFPGGLAGCGSNNIIDDNAASPAIGVHCIAGLGRAPMLVAIALIEAGMKPLEAVEYVRARRRGAFNSVQLKFLVEDYKPYYVKTAAKKSVLRGSFQAFGKKESDESLAANAKSASAKLTNAPGMNVAGGAKGFKAFWNGVVGKKSITTAGF